MEPIEGGDSEDLAISTTNADQESVQETDSKITRRSWIRRTLGASIAGATAVGLYARLFEPHWVEVVRRPMPIANLPSHLVGKTVVQISDTHIGDRVDSDFLIAWFKRIASWKPDLVVFTGDFISVRRNGSVPTKKLKRVLAEFPQGALGTFGILGNHDYGHRYSNLEVAAEIQAEAESQGIRILRNEVQTTSDMQIVGFDDFWGPNFGGKIVLKNVDHQKPTLVLCHNPDVADLPVWHDYQGWILSGHTHGGQCKPPFLDPPVLPVNNPRYTSGEIPLEDGRRIYINRALGYSMKVRFNVRPEITVFQLERAVA